MQKFVKWSRRIHFLETSFHHACHYLSSKILFCKVVVQVYPQTCLAKKATSCSMIAMWIFLWEKVKNMMNHGWPPWEQRIIEPWPWTTLTINCQAQPSTCLPRLGLPCHHCFSQLIDLQCFPGLTSRGHLIHLKLNSKISSNMKTALNIETTTNK